MLILFVEFHPPPDCLLLVELNALPDLPVQLLLPHGRGPV